ncbi:ATP-binding protein [Sorangium atrum]|uniref:histidine kinase n=1 Tax=Sorangium atrum TaxID=2995308 RepID=A0ABT5CAE1_9BACT|nr:HAMP domain-containing sensor histidine kinase [Sorangium aterium]MDC0682938.1 HAMP domain-containing sensor histidine kinase [Sorangium aterium]
MEAHSLNRAELASFPGLPSGAQLDALITREALRGERTASIARSVFCAALLARFLAVSGPPSPGAYARSLTEVPLLLGAVAASLYVWWRSRRIDASPHLILVSVGLDALLCFLALLPNVLWPWEGYPGILYVPDMAALLITVSVSAFRLLRRAVLLATAANALSALVLIVLDHVLNGSHGIFWKPPSLFFLLLLATASAALLVTMRTLRVVELGARSTLRAERAQRNLSVMLHEHHDVKTSLSAALIDTDLLRRELLRVESASAERMLRKLEQLRESIEDVASTMGHIRDRTMRELDALRATAPAEIGEATRGALRIVRRRYQAVKVDVTDRAERTAVLFAGGHDVLERVLLNLLVNACEGTGERGASSVTLDARPLGGGRVAIEVKDDGPGFHDTPSPKPGGSGQGLGFVAGMVESSGGLVLRANLPEGGAKVTIELLEAPV